MKNPPRTILITGAGSGLGRGLAQHLAQQGHSIIATDVQTEAAADTASQIQHAGGNAQSHALDVSSEADVQRFFSENSDVPIDVLINNAGLQRVARIEEYDIANWDLLCGVMVRGVFLMTRAVLPGMRARGFGRLIHIGSIHSHVASPYKTAYVAAKHALLGFSKVMALETADTDITSNTICPAYIRTPLVEGQIKAQARLRGITEKEVVENIMLGPMPKKAFITTEEIAGAAEYLISAAARNVTGQAITIDGGWTAQ